MTHYDYGPDGRIIYSTARRRKFHINPTWVVFLTGLGFGKLLTWGIKKFKETDANGPVLDQLTLSKEVAAVAQGPWGGPGGGEFYDGRGDIVGITIHFDSICVTGLQVTYEQSCARFQGHLHGDKSGETDKIPIAYPQEYIKQVTGTIAVRDAKSHRYDVVTSITFVTNKQTYGPYGNPRGESFQTPATGVVGFFGRSGRVLDQIGVFTKYSGPSRFRIA